MEYQLEFSNTGTINKTILYCNLSKSYLQANKKGHFSSNKKKTNEHIKINVQLGKITQKMSLFFLIYTWAKSYQDEFIIRQ